VWHLIVDDNTNSLSSAIVVCQKFLVLLALNEKFFMTKKKFQLTVVTLLTGKVDQHIFYRKTNKKMVLAVISMRVHSSSSVQWCGGSC